MKLTVLGCYGPYPKAGGACSGYLLEDKNTKILIDCGNGVLSRLFQHCDNLNKLDAIFISHLHPDHMSDLMILRYTIFIHKMLGKLDKGIPIYLPANPLEEFDRIQYNNSFIQNIINEDIKINIKGIDVTFKRTSHPVECYAMAFEKDNKKFTYSADTRYFDELIEFVKGSDLFLCESNILHKDMTETIPHLSARQAAGIALKAGAKKLLLTHFLPEINLEELFQEAREILPYNSEIVEEGKSYCI